VAEYLNGYLADELAVVVRRIGHRTSLPLDFYVWGYMKNKLYERKVDGRKELHHRIFDAARRMDDPDVLQIFQIISVTTEDRTMFIYFWLGMSSETRS
jgi:hypothetical protein